MQSSPPQPFNDFFRGIYEEIRFRLWHGPVFHRFLNRKYSFYTNLPPQYKLKFLRLVRDHYLYFEWVPRSMNLTRAMKAIICSGASQIVLFLPKQSLTFFERIIVYPDTYESLITHKHHKGEVNPRLKAIVFSWTGIAEGLNRPDDGLNLLLHEFAHALWLEHKLTKSQYTVLDEGAIEKFEELAAKEMQRMQQSDDHFLRAYALTNIEEFFAVAVENFFERSVQFQQQLPEIYNVLTHVFHLDPVKMNVKNAGLRIVDHLGLVRLPKNR